MNDRDGDFAKGCLIGILLSIPIWAFVWWLLFKFFWSASEKGRFFYRKDRKAFGVFGAGRIQALVKIWQAMMLKQASIQLGGGFQWMITKTKKATRWNNRN